MAYFDLSKTGVFNIDRISQLERNGRGTIGGLAGLGGKSSKGMLGALLQALNNLRTTLVPAINSQIGTASNALQTAQYEIDAARSRVENSSDPSALNLAARLDPLTESLATAAGQIQDAQSRMSEIDAVLALPDGDPGQAAATGAEATANSILTSLKGISAAAAKAVQQARTVTTQINQAEQRAAQAEVNRQNNEARLAAAEQRKIDQQFAIEQQRAQAQLNQEAAKQNQELQLAQQQAQLQAQLQAQQQAALVASQTPPMLPAPAYSATSTPGALPPPPPGYGYQYVDDTYQQNQSPYAATYTGLPPGYQPQAQQQYFSAPSQPQSLPYGWAGQEAQAQFSQRGGAPADAGGGFTMNNDFMPGFELFGLGGAPRGRQPRGRGPRGRRGLMGLGAETAAGRFAENLVNIAQPYIPGGAPPPPPPPAQSVDPLTIIAGAVAAWFAVPKLLKLIKRK